MDEKTKRLLDIKPSDISRGRTGNVIVFSNLSLMMHRLTIQQAVHRYYALFNYGTLIFEDSWDWQCHYWQKKLIKYNDEFYIAILQDYEVYSVEKIENPTPVNIYVEYELASKLRGDGIDGDSIYDVRLECKWKDYIRQELRKDESHSLCEP